MNTRLRSLLMPALIGGSCTVVALFSGCATASTSTGMTATAPAQTVVKHTQTVSVQVSGGSETSSMGASQISNANFAEAIETSIRQSGLFAKLVAAEGADYQLNARIVRLEQPTFGMSFTVNLEVDWSLVQRGTQKAVWEKAITSTFTATMGDAFAGVKRLRLANEGAARKNIADAIGQISALTLP